MKSRHEYLVMIVSLLAVCLLVHASRACAESEEELAKKAQNPVAALISLPLQYNQDYRIGPDEDAKRTTVNIQPVIPVSLNQDMNLIIRTIVPLVDAEATIPGSEGHDGMGDIVQSFFVSPKDTVKGWIVGFGPVFLYPTATDDAIGNEKWGAGPTGILLKQESGFTYGLLFNHLWSFAGSDSRDDFSATYIQPFFGYTTKTFTTLSVNTESTYGWREEQWIVPVNVTLTQMLKIGGQPLTLQAGYRYYAENVDNGADWGLRFMFTLLFPKE